MISSILLMIRNNNQHINKILKANSNNLKGDVPRDTKGRLLPPSYKKIEKREETKDKYGNIVEIRTTYFEY